MSIVALRWAAWFAAATGRSLWIAYAWQYGGLMDGDYLARPAEEIESAVEERLLELARRELDGSDLEIRARALRGTVAEALVREAHENDAAIIVVGAREGLRFPASLGSVSRALTECPTKAVAVVPYSEQELAPGEGTYVVGTDGSDHAARAIRWTAHAAGLGGNDVVAVHTFEHSLQDLDVTEEASLENEARERFEEEWCAPFRSREVSYATRFERGKPAQVMADLAESVEPVAIVVGTRGRGATPKTVLGRVTRHLLRSTSSPVVVIPGPRDCRRWYVEGVVN